MHHIREQIIQYSKNIKSTGALLLGPIGSGKSTIARIMAFMRFINLCKEDKRKQLLNNLLFDAPFRIDRKSLDFYEEINLTGLVPSLAQTQLFGIAKQVATGVAERPGLFEQAMTGHRSKDKKSVGATITGGIVFLDEIGDLHPDLQPLLLSVLTGTDVFRVGGEGGDEYRYKFEGSVIAATWKNFDDIIIRPDLISRLSSYIIKIPGLNERDENFEDIINIFIKNIKDQHAKELNRFSNISTSYISRSKIDSLKNRKLNLKKKDFRTLRNIDWSKRGNLRGLRQVLENCFYNDLSVDEALDLSIPLKMNGKPRFGDIADSFIEMLYGMDNLSISDAIKSVEKYIRREIAVKISNDKIAIKTLSKKYNITENRLKRKLEELKRDRSKRA